jgi:predicted Fe-Mo cluster-binding NifX family protein
MRVVVTAGGSEKDAAVDARFGRAAYFIVCDTEDPDTWEIVENAQNLQAAQGAGIQAAQHVVDANVQAVIAGNLGPKAFQVLKAADIRVFLVEGGTVEEAVEQFKNGNLKEQMAANVEGHWV